MTNINIKGLQSRTQGHTPHPPPLPHFLIGRDDAGEILAMTGRPRMTIQGSGIQNIGDLSV